ncbi:MULTISPECIES: hypothetical protein [Halobacterium]|uniref:DUF7311 family protein n=1 Tax=Halobacterium TaxID=2239 RepID=UPI00073EE10A|nr:MULTISPECIES: hypothetical protein [Halobacterium]MCG1002191.1 hypothetical protein [Halobacterium noricense]
MSVRVVLAVVFAFALVAAAQPAVDHATRTRDSAVVGASADRVADAVDALYRRSDPGETVETAPRRTLRLDLPADATLAVRDNPPRLISILPNGPEHQRLLPVRVAMCGDSTLDGPTTLAYVERADGPVVLALRGFIRGNATTASHACAPRTLPG